MQDVVCDKGDWDGRHAAEGSPLRQLLDGAAGALLVVSPDATASQSIDENPNGSYPMSAVLDYALASRMLVIPILTHGMQLSDLMGPGPFAELLQLAPLELRHINWNDDVARIVDRIEWQLSDPKMAPYWRFSLDGGTNGRRRPRWVRFAAHADQVRRRFIPRSRYWRCVSRVTFVLLIVVIGFGGYRAYRLWDERYDRAASRLVTQLSYTESVNATTAAIRGLEDVALRARSSRVSDFVVLALKGFVLAGPRYNGDARLLRRRALEALKGVRANDLTADFSRGEFRGSELFRVDLSLARLQQVSFEDASLEGVRFTGADLTNANLSGVYVRNGDFSGATLRGADLTDLDWYNAKGVTEAQLRSAVQNRIRRCPSDEKTRSHSEAAFLADLTNEYSMKWQQFAEIDRVQLTQLWSEYARPGGLCDRLDRW